MWGHGFHIKSRFKLYLFQFSFSCYYCSKDSKRQSEHSGFCPDTNSLDSYFSFSKVFWRKILIFFKHWVWLDHFFVFFFDFFAKRFINLNIGLSNLSNCFPVKISTVCFSDGFTSKINFSKEEPDFIEGLRIIVWILNKGLAWCCNMKKQLLCKWQRVFQTLQHKKRIPTKFVHFFYFQD